MTTMKTLAGSAIAVAVSFMACAQPGPLFKATFDTWNTAPDEAVEKGVLKEGIDPELQLRMCADVRGAGVKGNSLSLTVPEFVAYPCGGNFRPDRGTVLFWVRPMNYTLADSKYFQPYFSVEAQGYQFYIYKYSQSPDALLLFMRYKGRNHVCRAPAKWAREQWHHVAVSWSPNGIAIYIDGAEAKRTTIDPPGDLPRQGELKGAKMALGDPRSWSSLVKGRLTQFDDLTVYGRELSAKEVYDVFAAARPDLAANRQAPAAAEETAPLLTYRTIAAENKLKVRIDLGAADLKSGRDIPVRLRLAKKGSKDALVARDVVFPELDSEVDFPLGELEDGTDYVIAAKIPGVKKISSATLHVPDRTLYAKPLPRDREVPTPWFPVKRIGERRFAVLDREYEFGANIYPVRVVSRGEEVVAKAPAFLLGGKAVAWREPSVVAEHGDCTEFSATGETDAFRFRGRGELWFDGFYKAEIEVEPKDGAAEIPSLDLVWTVPRAAARYLLTPDWAPWEKDGNFTGTFGVDRNDTSVVWTTGPACGFAWWCASDANWVTDGRPNVSVRRTAGEASVRVKIIAKPSVLKGVATYVTGVQGTPAKRPDPAWRDRWYWGIGGDWTTCNWSSYSGKKAGDNMKHVTSLVPAYPKEFNGFLQRKRTEGLDVLVYSMPTHLCNLDEEWDWYYDTWSSLPGIRWSFKDEFSGRQARLMPCCASTGAGDWHVSRAERLFRENPLLKGLYYDISSCTRCDNVLHGHGGIDAFGKPYGTSKAMDLRDYFLRIAKLCRKYDRWLHIHAHNLYMPFVHSFGDVCWPGEEQFHLYVDNPRYHYLEGIPAEKYESALNPEIRGMAIAFINQNERAGSQVPSVFEKDPDAFVGTNAVYATLMPSLVYDFRDLGGTFGRNEKIYGDLRNILRPLKLSKATHHPYWAESYATAADGIRTALYTWADGAGASPFLLVVGNFSREDRASGVTLDWAKVGSPSRPLKDLLTGRVFTEKELAEFKVASHRFLLLVPEKGADGDVREVVRGEDFTMLNIIPSRPGDEAVAAQDAIEYVERTGNPLCLYCLTLHPQGKPAMKTVDAAIASYRRWAELLKGTSVRPGVLLQAIVGHWTQALAEKDAEDWQRAVNVDGKVTRYCPLDPGYRNYIREVGRKLAECRPSVILGDDDIRAFSPDAECFCPLHTAEFNRRTGRKLSSEEFRALIRAAKPGDADHTAFAELQRDTVKAVCALLREGIDAVDPSVPAGTCTPGWVWSMRYAPDFARAIAGKSQTPFFRLPNGQYYEHSPKADVGVVTLRTLSECERLKDSGVWMLDEADTWPHCLWSKSSVAFHGKLAVAAFSGLKGAKLWCVNAHKGPFPVSRHYTDILAEHRGFYPALAAAARGSSASGVLVPCHPEFPAEPVSERRYVWAYDLEGWTDQIFSWYGIPFAPTFDFDREGVYALAGAGSIARFTDGQIRKMLSRRALVDGDAAVALIKRGFGDLLGVETVEARPLFTGEYDEVNRTFLTHPKTSNPPIFAGRDGARPLAHLIWRESGFSKSFERVAPSAVIWTNGLGGVTVTTAMKVTACYAERLGPGRQRYVYALLDALNGRTTDNICANEQNVMALSRRAADGGDLVLVQNLNFDSDEAVLLRRGVRPSSVEELDRHGTWRSADVAYADGVVRIGGAWKFYDTRVFRIR